MKIEWKEELRDYHVARVGAWKLKASSQTSGSAHVKVSLDGVVLFEGSLQTWSLDEAKAAAERWVRGYVAPFVEAAVEAERAACAEIAGRIAEINATARSKMVDPSNAAVREVEARIETANAIAQRILERRDGAK